MRRWGEGDIDAFNELIGNNLDSAQRLALRLTHDKDIADDVVSEALLRVHRAASSFRGGAQFKTWLHRIVVNCALDAKRKRSIQFVPLDSEREEEDGSKVRLQCADHGPSPLDLVLRAEYFDEIEEDIREMDDEHRTLVLLYNKDELGYAAISHEMEIPIGTVKSRLHRARQTLKDRLDRTEARCERWSSPNNYEDRTLKAG